MFDQLVESTSERKNAKIMTLFLVNSVLGAIALFATVVIGIMWYDAQLNYEFEKLARSHGASGSGAAAATGSGTGAAEDHAGHE